MTLDEMLALLPDTPEGNISAADLRTVVTELHGLASLFRTTFAYTWKATGVPQAVGDVTMDQPWQMFATKMLLSETAQDGLIPSWALLEDASEVTFALITADGAKMTGSIDGPPVDQGVYREVPITPATQEGTPPSGGERVTVVIYTRLGDS